MCFRLYPDDDEEGSIERGDFIKVVVLFEREQRVEGGSRMSQWSFAFI